MKIVSESESKKRSEFMWDWGICWSMNGYHDMGVEWLVWDVTLYLAKYDKRQDLQREGTFKTCVDVTVRGSMHNSAGQICSTCVRRCYVGE